MRLTINLPDDVFDGLRDLARGEYRSVRDQAAWVVVQAVRSAMARVAPESGGISPGELEDDDGAV